ncbi:MAG TPA: hypothetical protein VF584_14065 [Longimicrobium sp.]|jgi:hypothetical protein
MFIFDVEPWIAGPDYGMGAEEVLTGDFHGVVVASGPNAKAAFDAAIEYLPAYTFDRVTEEDLEQIRQVFATAPWRGWELEYLITHLPEEAKELAESGDEPMFYVVIEHGWTEDGATGYSDEDV